jgi:hypothetical protein
LAAFAAGPIDVLVTLFTHARSYSLPLPAQTFSKKSTTQFAMLLGTPAFFAIPDDDVVEAAYADIPATSDSGVVLPCIVSRLIVSDALRPKNSREAWPTPPERASREEIVKLFAGGAKVTGAATLRGDEPPPTCAQPYQMAHFLAQSMPDLREISRMALGTGAVEMEVVLSPQGRVEFTRVLRSSGSSSLDSAIKRSAENSTYAPDVFRCEPVRSAYRFAIVSRVTRQ